MASGKQPTRMCVICRRRSPKHSLVRHVRRQDAGASGPMLAPDIRQTAPGRGWYCCDQPECRDKMARYRAFRKNSKGGVHERKTSG
jgi:hypothetical protein